MKKIETEITYEQIKLLLTCVNLSKNKLAIEEEKSIKKFLIQLKNKSIDYGETSQ